MAQPGWRWHCLACLLLLVGEINGTAAAARQPVLLRGAPEDGVRLGRLLQQNSDKLSIKYRNGTHEDFLPPGYPLETHKVYTEDGWVLRLYRIPHGGQRNTKPGPRPVVLLWHGFSLSSLSFALWRQNESIAYILADAGFDVWMGNNRGNDYSRGNLNYHYRDERYWYFSADELALIDVPASINFILEKTGASKLGMLTHSQGGALAYAMMADLPHMQQKVSVLIAMGPPVFMEYMRAPVLKNWALTEAENMLVLVAAGEILRSRSTSAYGFQCRDFQYGEFCTTQTVHMFYGPSAIVPPDDWVVIGHTWPATVSTRNIRHWVQMIKDGRLRFQHFDFGSDCSNRTRFYETCNQEKYGTIEPPEYDLTKVKIPVFIMQGELDIMVVEEDVLEQVRRLPNAGLIVYQGYSHQDFVWDRNAKHAADVVDLLFRYSPGTFYCCNPQHQHGNTKHNAAPPL